MQEQTNPPQLTSETVSINREDENWQEHVLSLWKDKEKEEAQNFLKELYPADIAFLIERINRGAAWKLFTTLYPKERGEVLNELHASTRQYYIEELEPESLASILETIPSDSGADLLRDLDKIEINKVLGHLPEIQRIRIIELLGYTEKTAGAIMTKEFVAVQASATLKEAIDVIRKSKIPENIHTIFVVDKAGHYQGHVSLPKLITARPQNKVKHIMEEELMPIPVDTDQEEVGQYFTRYDFITAPVVSSGGSLLGRITADDVLQVVQKEASEDILRMGGLAEEEHINSPLLRSALHRTTWLLLNLVTVLISVLVIRLFSETIEKAVILAVLMPVVVSLGGNAGGQSMTLAIRNIALGELTHGVRYRLFFRELITGLFNGFILGLVTSSVVYISMDSYPLASILFLSIMVTIFFAGLIGFFIPQLLRYLHIDPAIGSVILVTAFSDAFGFFLFLGLASLTV